jgi:hypothetical protein
MAGKKYNIKSYLIFVFGGSGLIFYFIFLKLIMTDESEYYKKNLYSESWKSIVEEKKISKWNKEEPIIYFNTRGERLKFCLTSTLNKGKAYEIYNYIQIGDSVIKEKNSGILIIKRNNEAKEFNLDPNYPFKKR